jgi:pyruvate dehydrogenase E1 component beta subunit
MRLVRERAGPQGRAPYRRPTPRACSRRDPRSEPGDLPRERDLYGQSFDVPKLDDFVLPIGKAKVVRPART